MVKRDTSRAGVEQEGTNAEQASAAAQALSQSMRAAPRAIGTSRLGRLWHTGRAAAGAASAVLSGRLRGRGDGLGAADLAAVARLTERLGAQKGLAMKAGQLLGFVDPSLAPEARALLSVLHTESPPSPFAAITQVIEASLGARGAELVAALEREPVAVASIAEVHRARLADGRELAVKVRHPGIVAALEADFRSAGAGAAFARLLAPGTGATVRGCIDEVARAVLEECDFRLEAERQQTFAALFAGHPVIAIPEVLPAWSSDAVLTSGWLPGRSLDAFVARAPTQRERDRVGTALFEFYIGTLYRHGLFHADPHPGNYAFRDDGKLVVYDFGCVRRFERDVRAALAALVGAVARDERAEIEGALAALGATPPAGAAQFAHLRGLLRAFFAPFLTPGRRAVDPGAGFAGQALLRDKRALLGLALPPALMFLFRVRFGLYAVLARIGSVADWAALERGYAAAVSAPSEPVALAAGAALGAG